MTKLMPYQMEIRLINELLDSACHDMRFLSVNELGYKPSNGNYEEFAEVKELVQIYKSIKIKLMCMQRMSQVESEWAI